MIVTPEHFQIEMLAYSPVERGLKKSWQQSTLSMTLDPETELHFNKFIQSMWNETIKKPTSYPGIFEEKEKTGSE
jgi:hypothetical protein